MSWAASSAYGPDAPKPAIDAQIKRGWRPRSPAASTPSRRAVDGRKLSTRTSLRAINASSTRCASGDRRSSVTLRLFRHSSSKYRRSATRRMPSPPRGSSILMISAPRSDSSSVAYAPGSSRVRSRMRTPRRGSRTLAQFAVAESVREVQHQADHQPNPEALPRAAGQAIHDEPAARRREHAHEPHEWDAERPRPIRFRISQHEHANADEHEREQRADVRQIVGFPRVADQRL